MSKNQQNWTWTGGLEEAKRRHQRGHWEDGGQTWVESACDEPIHVHSPCSSLAGENDDLNDKMETMISRRVAISACVGAGIIGFITGFLARLFLFG